MRIDFPSEMTQEDLQRVFADNERRFVTLQIMIDRAEAKLNARIHGMMKMLYIYAGIYFGGALVLPFFLNKVALALWPIVGVGFLFGHLMIALPALQNYTFAASAEMVYILSVNHSIAEHQQRETSNSKHHKT